MPGIRMWVTNTSGWRLASISMIPSAFSKALTSMPACFKALSKTQRIERSSSMIQTRMPLPMQFSVFMADGEQHGKYRPPRLAVTLDQAAVLID